MRKKFRLMEYDYSSYCYEGTEYFTDYVPLPSGVELMRIVFSPPQPDNKPVIIFIPGLISIIDNFREVLIELTRFYTVHYIETREKRSSLIGNHHRFTVSDIRSDLIQYTEIKLPPETPFIMVGYSLGATAIAEAVPLMKKKPEAIILIQPNASFPFQWWLLLLSGVARYIYNPVKPFLKWYLRTFRINIKQDNEMYLINCRNLDTADPARIGRAIRDLSHYHNSEALSDINIPALVVVASKDKFHSHDEGSMFARLIKNSCYLDMEDNRRTHSALVAKEIEKFIASPEQKPVQEDLLRKDIF